jgi:hypothetical protein
LNEIVQFPKRKPGHAELLHIWTEDSSHGGLLVHPRVAVATKFAEAVAQFSFDLAYNIIQQLLVHAHVMSLAAVEFPTPHVKNEVASLVLMSARLMALAVPAVLAELYCGYSKMRITRGRRIVNIHGS